MKKKDFINNQSQNTSDIGFYTAKVPYAFNIISVNESLLQITSDVAAPNKHHHGIIRKPHSAIHHHDYFEVMYVISGSIVQIIENEKINYKAGECCILNRNINHCEIYQESSKILFMMLTEEFLSPLVDKNFIYSTSNIFHNTFNSICHLIRQNQKCKYYTAKEYISFTPSITGTEHQNLMISLQELVGNIVNATTYSYPGSEFIIAGLISRFFSILENESKYYKNVIHLVGSNTEKLIEKLTHIFEEKNGKITRSELECMMHYNADYLNRIVKKATGFTLVEYRQLFSLQEAAFRLLHTNASIANIMSDLGFSNRTYFNKIFIAKYGMPPSEYRKRNKAD